MIALLCCCTGTWALDRDTENYYILSSLQDWQDFASLAQTVPTINARMIADINLGDDQTMIGSYATRYSGTFDGQGHTLTFNYNTSSMSIESDQSYLGAAPFRDIEGATIRNLRTAGSITADKIGASGLVGWAYGTNTIENCWSDVNLVSSNNGADTFTGFVAFMYGTSITITDCIFTGLIQSTSKRSHSGFIGYHHSGTSALTNCLVILDEGSDTNENYGWHITFFTFDRFASSDQSAGSYTNCYYYRDFGVVQGAKVTDEQLADGFITTALQAGRAETVWGQDGISGQPRLDVFNHPITTYEPYVHPTSQIINLSELTADYIAQDGDVLTGTTGYSIQIAADATITLSDVTITNYQKSPIECLGNATINIEDGSVNTLKESDEDSESYARPALAFGPSGTTLTINGNTGRLNAIGGRFSPGIGCRASSGAYGGLIINGGIISVYGNGATYTHGIGATDINNHGPSCGDITINGGTISASGSYGVGIGAGGTSWCGAISINGGTITSHATGSIAIGGNCSKVMIYGGEINASTNTGVGIGSSVVYIDGGTIVASASDWEGVGISGDKGVLIRSSITSLTASKGPYGANAIRGGTVYISENLNDVTEGNTRTLTPKASFDPDTDIAQDGEGYYLIGSLQNWKEFVVLSQIEASPKAKMVADINLGDEQAIIGSFDGLFDGQGHTITINLSTTTQYVGLFCDIIDATIKNLHVTGSINTTKRFVGGMVGRVYYGTSTIQNCWSSVNVTTTYSGDGVQGGMIGCVNGTLNISDCLYDGALNGSSAYTWGGFVGWLYGTTNIDNCLFASNEMNVGSSSTATHVAGGGNITNCYYKNVMGTAQGTQATSAQLADGTIATALQNSRAEEVWVQDPLTNQPMLKIFANAAYTVPSSGIGTFSAKAKFALPDGLTAHYCKTYNSANGTIGVVDIDGVVPANTGVLLKGTPGETYTLTRTNSDAATVEGNALVAVTEATHVDPIDGDYTNFMMSGGTFIKIEASDDPNVKMPANRAYLKILTSELPSDPLLARGITLSWDDDATSISEMEKWKNGENEKFYDLQGRLIVNGKLSNGKLPKGLYINNGRKVVIK